MGSPKYLDPSKSPRAFYGAELRRLREQANLTQDRLGELVFCSGAYLGQIEAAVRQPQMDMSVRLDGILKTGGLLARLCELVNQTKHAVYFAGVVDLEQRAASISEFAPMIVPGLLQIEQYARELTHAVVPWVPDDVVGERVRARLERAAIVKDLEGPRLWFVLHEAVLQCVVGEAAVMRDQLWHIIDLIRARRIVVQVMPRSAGAEGHISESLMLMTFDDAPPLAYVEGVHTGLLLDDPTLVASYRQSYDLARAVALSPMASLELISTVAEGYSECA
jgi:transcriptional regulator with XRE-family HTH domain